MAKKKNASAQRQRALASDLETAHNEAASLTREIGEDAEVMRAIRRVSEDLHDRIAAAVKDWHKASNAALAELASGGSA